MVMKNLILLMFLAVSTPLFSQISSSSLRGKIRSVAGKEIPNLSISITYSPTALKYNVMTNSKGFFSLYNINCGGPYKIRIEADGYRVYEKREIFLELGDEND